MANWRRKEITDDEALELALRDHPQWRRQWNDGTLPDEIVGEDGEPMSPRMHIELHKIVERQLAADDPKGIVAVARQLEQLGVSRHDIRHAIARAVASEIWHINTQGSEFDRDRYFAELRETVEEYRQDVGDG